MTKTAGINLADMIDVFNVSNARSYASEIRFPKHILSGKWDARSRVYNLRKDVSMAVELAGKLDTKCAGDRHARLSRRRDRAWHDRHRLFTTLRALRRNRRGSRQKIKSKSRTLTLREKTQAG
jgi:hypothetical protein